MYRFRCQVFDFLYFDCLSHWLYAQGSFLAVLAYPRGCQGSNPGWQCARQSSSPLCYGSSLWCQILNTKHSLGLKEKCCPAWKSQEFLFILVVSDFISHLFPPPLNMCVAGETAPTEEEERSQRGKSSLSLGNEPDSVRFTRGEITFTLNLFASLPQDQLAVGFMARETGGDENWMWVELQPGCAGYMSLWTRLDTAT